MTVMQHECALARANEVRLARAALKRAVKVNPRLILEVLEEPPDYCATMELVELLMALPRWGRLRARRVIRQLATSSENIQIGKLTPRVRGVLLEHLRWAIR